MDKHDLEERLINFAELILEIVGTMPNIKATNHLTGQLLRSGTSPALSISHCRMKIINQKSLILVLKLIFTIQSAE